MMPTAETALEIEGLSKSFRIARRRADGRGGTEDPRRERLSWRHDRFWALREVGFRVARGETVGLIGPNGSGKSTLLKILSGVMTPDGGRIEAQGRIGALLELGAGFHPDLTGIENVYLNGALLGLSTRQIDQLLPAIIEFAELERFMDMPVRHYSSGMTARLGFAVATQLAPDILLMDETFAAGDARFQAKALDHVTAMKGRGHTLILVSHNMEMMLHLADRVIWLERGQVHRDGGAREVLAEYQRGGRLNQYALGRMRAALGMESLYEAVDEASTIRIASARLRTARENASAGEGDATLAIEAHENVWLDIEITHPENGPEAIEVETAWVRDDEKVLAQSRTRVKLAAGAARTGVTLRFGPWNLTEAKWRMALALAPARSGESSPQSLSNLYHDRRFNAGAIRIITPNPFELPVVTAIPNHWRVDG